MIGVQRAGGVCVRALFLECKLVLVLVSVIGLASRGCARSGERRLEVVEGRLVVMSDCRERHVRWICAEVGEVDVWQEDAGGESMVSVGMWEVREVGMRGAQSKDDGRSILQGVLSEGECGEPGALTCCLALVVRELCAGYYSKCAACGGLAIVVGV